MEHLLLFKKALFSVHCFSFIHSFNLISFVRVCAVCVSVNLEYFFCLYGLNEMLCQLVNITCVLCVCYTFFVYGF